MGIYYRGIIDNIGLNVRVKKPYIPDYHLMIGTAENLASVPLLLYNDFNTYIPKPLQKPIEQMKLEDVTMKLDGVQYTTDDFVNNTFFIGNAVGGY